MVSGVAHESRLPHLIPPPLHRRRQPPPLPDYGALQRHPRPARFCALLIHTMRDTPVILGTPVQLSPVTSSKEVLAYSFLWYAHIRFSPLNRVRLLLDTSLGTP